MCCRDPSGGSVILAATNVAASYTPASIFFTAAMVRAFGSARSLGNGTLRNLHEMQVAR